MLERREGNNIIAFFNQMRPEILSDRQELRVELHMLELMRLTFEIGNESESIEFGGAEITEAITRRVGGDDLGPPGEDI